MPGHDFATGEVLTAANVDAYLNNSYYAQMRQSVAQNLSDGVATALTFTSEDFDTDSGHDNASNTSRYTCQTTGIFRLAGGCGFTANLTGQRMLQWAKNGSVINGSTIRMPPSANGNAMAARTILVSLTAGDYVELLAHQNTGGVLATVITSDLQSTMTVERVSS